MFFLPGPEACIRGANPVLSPAPGLAFVGQTPNPLYSPIALFVLFLARPRGLHSWGTPKCQTLSRGSRARTTGLLKSTSCPTAMTTEVEHTRLVLSGDSASAVTSVFSGRGTGSGPATAHEEPMEQSKGLSRGGSHAFEHTKQGLRSAVTSVFSEREWDTSLMIDCSFGMIFNTDSIWSLRTYFE